MKKLILLILVCLFILISCGDNQNEEKVKIQDNQSQIKQIDPNQAKIENKLNLKQALDKTLKDINLLINFMGAYLIDNMEYPKGTYNDLIKIYNKEYKPKKLPKKDGWGNSYYYSCKDGNKFILASSGPNGKLELNIISDDIYLDDEELIIGKKLRLE